MGWVRLVGRRRVKRKGDTYFTWNPKFDNCCLTVELDLLRQIGVDDGQKVDFIVDPDAQAIAIAPGNMCKITTKPDTSRVKLTSRTLYKALPFAYESGEVESTEVKEIDGTAMIIVRLRESKIPNKAYDKRMHRGMDEGVEPEADDEEDEDEDEDRNAATSRKAAKKVPNKAKKAA